jgi:hypothetical protein
MTTPAPSRASISHKPVWRRQQFWRVALPALAVACAVVAGILVYNAFVQTSHVGQSPGAQTTYPDEPKQQSVKFDPAAREVARRFILTAVARKNLAEAYTFSGPDIREGMTLKQWNTGNIAVVPYKVNDATVANIKIDESFKTSAKLEILMSTPTVKSQIFFMDLIKKRGKWLVNAWVPRSPPPIPGTQ